MNTEDKWREVISSRLLSRSDFVNVQLEDGSTSEHRAQDVPELANIYKELFPEQAPVLESEMRGTANAGDAAADVTVSDESESSQPPEAVANEGVSLVPDVISLNRDYAGIVAKRAADCDTFVKQYSVRFVGKTATRGEFALLAKGERADVWAVPVENGRIWFLVPGRDVIRNWSYLSAMGGRGAAERLNGAYEFEPGAYSTLRVISPAIASSKDGANFVISTIGKLSGVDAPASKASTVSLKPSAQQDSANKTTPAVALPIPPNPKTLRNFALIMGGIFIVVVVLARSCTVQPGNPPPPSPQVQPNGEASYTVTVETNLRSAPTVSYDTRVRSPDNTPITIPPGSIVTGTIETSATDPTSKWLKLSQGPYTGNYVWMGRLVAQ